MDVDWFLKERTKFIRQYYAAAITPFEALKSQIENGEEPYQTLYSEDGELPFQGEWSDADASVQVVGRTCVTLLSESVKLYFQTWEELFGVKCQPALAPLFKKQGFVAGYKECFRRMAELNWEECPADLSIIEQIVLARNVAAHHSGDVGTMSVPYPKKGREKLESPLFLHDYEKRALDEDQKSVFTFLGSLSRERRSMRLCGMLSSWWSGWSRSSRKSGGGQGGGGQQMVFKPAAERGIVLLPRRRSPVCFSHLQLSTAPAVHEESDGQRRFGCGHVFGL
jgi:hypothetical protein